MAMAPHREGNCNLQIANDEHYEQTKCNIKAVYSIYTKYNFIDKTETYAQY